MIYFPRFEKELLKSIHVNEEHPQFKVYLDYGLNRFKYGKKLIELLSSFIQNKDMNVLDIGCGVGGISAAFADGGIRVISSEFDVNYKNLIRSIFLDIEKMPGLLVADGQDLPVREGYFNTVLAIDILEHVEDIDKFVSELARITEDNGIICMTISTRFDWNNIKKDPHYGLFGIILLPRFLRKLIVVKLTMRNPTLDDFFWIRSYKSAFKLFKNQGILLKRFADTVLGLKVSSSVVDVGNKRDIFFLETEGKDPDSGWHDREDHDGYSQRWTKKKAGGYILIPREATKFNIEVSSCNPEITESRLMCKVKLEKTQIGQFELCDTNWHEFDFKIPEKLCDGGIKHFELRVDKTWVPAYVSGTEDARALGVAVRCIRCK